MKLLIKYVFIIFVIKKKSLHPGIFRIFVSRNIAGFRDRCYEISNPTTFKNQFRLASLVCTYVYTLAVGEDMTSYHLDRYDIIFLFTTLSITQPNNPSNKKQGKRML